MLEECLLKLKVLSYWNLNLSVLLYIIKPSFLKVLSYWNLNVIDDMVAKEKGFNLKYYHIGI